MLLFILPSHQSSDMSEAFFQNLRYIYENLTPAFVVSFKYLNHFNASSFIFRFATERSLIRFCTWFLSLR